MKDKPITLNKADKILEDLLEEFEKTGGQAMTTAKSFEELRNTMVARAPFLCRWWLRTRRRHKSDWDGVNTNPFIFYVPWWGWPFELAHRLIFGSTKIK